MSDFDTISTAEFIASLRHPSLEEIEEMRRIGAQPGACGIDEDGNLEVVQGPPERPKR